MAPEKIGRYQIKSELGRGGMATVYEAYDPRFEREVAVKVLPREMLHDPQFRVRFEREAKTIALLEHQAIVPVYDYGEEEGQPYFVMRYMTGGSLSDRIRKGALTLQEAARIMNRLAPALVLAAARGCASAPPPARRPAGRAVPGTRVSRAVRRDRQPRPRARPRCLRTPRRGRAAWGCRSRT